NLPLVLSGCDTPYPLLRLILAEEPEELPRRVDKLVIEPARELQDQVLELPVLVLVRVDIVEPVDLKTQELFIVRQPRSLIVSVSYRLEQVLGDVRPGAHEDIDVPLLDEPPDYLPLPRSAQRAGQTHEDCQALPANHLGPDLGHLAELLPLKSRLRHLIEEAGDALLPYLDRRHWLAEDFSLSYHAFASWILA